MIIAAAPVVLQHDGKDNGDGYHGVCGASGAANTVVPETFYEKSGCDGMCGASGAASTMVPEVCRDTGAAVKADADVRKRVHWSDGLCGASGAATVVVTGYDQCINSEGSGARGTAPAGIVAANRRAKPSIGSQSNGVSHDPDGIDRRALKKNDPIGRSGK